MVYSYILDAKLRLLQSNAKLKDCPRGRVGKLTLPRPTPIDSTSCTMCLKQSSSPNHSRRLLPSFNTMTSKATSRTLTSRSPTLYRECNFHQEFMHRHIWHVFREFFNHKEAMKMAKEVFTTDDTYTYEHPKRNKYKQSKGTREG